MDGTEPSGFNGAYNGMIKKVIPTVTPTAAKSTKKKVCTVLEGCVCGTLLGCLIKANGNVELFFKLFEKYPIIIVYWTDFTELNA